LVKQLAPALYHNTSIKVLDISWNSLNDMEYASIIRDILRRDMSITALDLSRNTFGQIHGAVDCIAEGLCRNRTLLKIDLSSCDLRDGGVSSLAKTIFKRYTALHKLTLRLNAITSKGARVLLKTMEQSSHHVKNSTWGKTLLGIREQDA
jgi:Ran GTPase-activating protein (RanGAP) involved in mRNA processing and transport